MVKKIILGLLIAIVIIGAIVLMNWLLPVDMAAIEVAAEPIFAIGPFVVTNALFTSFLLSIFILVVAFFVGRSLKEQPAGMQNIIEFMIEALDGLITSLAPKKWHATFFPILVTIFIYLLVANWFSLFTPLLGSFGLVHPTEHGGVPVENVTFLPGGREEVMAHAEEHSEGELNVMIVPLLRAPSSDLNLTFALALVTMTLVWVFGFREHGPGYLGNFFRFKAFKEKGVLMGLIDFVIGLIELISEFAKIISFSFRLFGNIFAGEVVLIVISGLATFLIVVVFFGFEIFVGLVQAFVFFILSLVFFSLATQHQEH